MDELASLLGLPRSKEVTWAACRHKKRAELVITRESEAEKKEIES